jgi:hypothetical protein
MTNAATPFNLDPHSGKLRRFTEPSTSAAPIEVPLRAHKRGLDRQTELLTQTLVEQTCGHEPAQHADLFRGLSGGITALRA